jgi:hypothetical protein
MKTFCILTATVLLCGSVHARIGESPEEIQQRYGKPKTQGEKVDKGSGLPQSHYIFKDYSITVVFQNGKCVREWVNKKNYGNITDEESFELVKGITGEIDLKNNGRRHWTGANWKAMVGTSIVVVTSNTYTEQVKAFEIEQANRRAAEAKKKTAGF